ncbi:endosialidase [Anaerotignum lactatifermentans]|uniref:Endosialidase n=1 Tax=Anaerotignum lactatifermentans TaxID=160404 RepID=A0ABS2G900_9FIRM|nr:endosialidase [Anaerotignum lactatifermentans]MBM6828377.1 endosialidase [Anaerotignum lactatifermentans]MBM6877657.1 endosialidase [Anaerotignum lactatifermentans]MBM6949960.1 endosialidase [Anaerotignum lactatifermentans]
MAVIEELIRKEDDGSISFGNYLMDEKKKVLDFEVQGDLYKVKTFREITKLEKNGKMLLEVVPGATVHNFLMSEKGVSFVVEAKEDLQMTLELEAETEYRILVDDVNLGKMKTNMAGKVTFSLEVQKEEYAVKISKIG